MNTDTDQNGRTHLPAGTKIKIDLDMEMSFKVGSNGHIETNSYDYGKEKITAL